ncbi:MAG: TusE/DsrC/DsvC family sulfur relay protein, partial [Candidatus Electryoneaceae bacterium]|nr:TusE/DsrC/DsvC family sulfur relay protein [Candidatus Electryoneaceae bacterium]
RTNKIGLRQLRGLFPTGYLRGACKLSGITYREGYLKHSWVMKKATEDSTSQDKTYTIDIRGFLVNPDEWDEQFAIYKAFEMKMPAEMTDRHWQIIRFLREYYGKNDSIPTVYDTSEANNIEIEELEELFPDGYHRGVVKLAGLRVR